MSLEGYEFMSLEVC